MIWHINSAFTGHLQTSKQRQVAMQEAEDAAPIDEEERGGAGASSVQRKRF